MIPVNQTPAKDPPAPLLPEARPSFDPGVVFSQVLPRVLKMARMRGFDEQAQRDIAQAVGVVLVEHRDRYDARQGTPSAWAVGIATNVIRDKRRQEKTERRFIDTEQIETANHQPSADLTPEQSARARSMIALIDAELTEEERRIFDLRAADCTAQEIAALLGLTQSRVEQRIREARVRVAALFKRLGEEKQTAAGVRAVLLPFATWDDLETVLRNGNAHEGLAEELRSARMAQPSPLGPVAHAGARMALSTGQLTAGAAVIFLCGAITGVAVFATVNPPGPTPPTEIAAEPSPVAPVAPASTTALAAPGPAETARATPTVATSTDPAALTASALLELAMHSPPQRALALAQQHERRFPRENVGKREGIILRALVALGRRGEAEARARTLKGTIYEKISQDALERIRFELGMSVGMVWRFAPCVVDSLSYGSAKPGSPDAHRGGVRER